MEAALHVPRRSALLKFKIPSHYFVLQQNKTGDFSSPKKPCLFVK
jgi:hypothetical protein